jgi:hypothetical protein
MTNSSTKSNTPKFQDNPYAEKARNQIINNGNNSNNSSFGVQNGQNAFNQAPVANRADINQSVLDALNFAGMAQTQANSGITNREQATSSQSASNYNQKRATDYQYEQLSNANQARNANNTITSSTTKSDPTDMYRRNNMERNNKAQENNLAISKAAQDRYNQELLTNAQANANIRLANAQGNTQKEVAAINAQGSMLSSLFGSLGSIGSGNPNYRFWN